MSEDTRRALPRPGGFGGRDFPAWMERPDVMSSVDKVRPFTLAPVAWLVDLAWQVRAVRMEDIPGDFVECGTWRGGAAFLIADLLRQAGVGDRKVWLFDSFEGTPPPAEIDGSAAMAWAQDTDSPSYHDNYRVSLEEVQWTARELGLARYTEFVKGWFEETLPETRGRVGPIALLRIDVTCYSSVRACLDHLYDQVMDGGFVLFDAYHTYDGCAIAVHEFLGERRLAHRIESLSDSPDATPHTLFRKGRGTWHETRNAMKWFRWRQLATEELVRLIPPGDAFILVDEDQWGARKAFDGRRPVPFLERAGQYWGAPPDDDTASRELERLRQAGADFIVFAWPAFWWLDHYSGFHRYLRSGFRCVLEDDRLVVFDLRSQT